MATTSTNTEQEAIQAGYLKPGELAKAKETAATNQTATTEQITPTPTATTAQTTTSPVAKATTSPLSENAASYTSSTGGEAKAPSWLADIIEFNKNMKKQQETTASIKARGGTSDVTSGEGTKTGTAGTSDTTGIDFSKLGTEDFTKELAKQYQLGGEDYARLLQSKDALASMGYSTKEDARRKQLIGALGQTNLAGRDLSKLDTASLENLYVSEVGDLSEDAKKRIREGGAAQIETEKIALSLKSAENNYAKRQAERAFDAAIDERKEYNAQQDIKMRRMAAAFGGGQVSRMSDNVAIMKEEQKGIDAVNKIRETYVDQTTLFSARATEVIDTYRNNVRVIQNTMNSQIEEQWLGLQSKIDTLVSQGMTNELDLQKELATDFETYIKDYRTYQKESLNSIRDLNNDFINQQSKLAEDTLKADKQMSDMTGYIYSGGKILQDSAGNQMTTMDYINKATDNDIKLMLGTGYFWKNNQMVTGIDGSPIALPLTTKEQITLSQAQTRIDETYRHNITSEGLSAAKASGTSGAALPLGSLGEGTRADRHNNPTAAKVYPGIAKKLTDAGLEEGTDFFTGETTYGIDSDSAPTIAYKDAETGIKGAIALLQGGQISSWYATNLVKKPDGTTSGYGGGAKVRSAIANLSGKKVNATNAQAVFNELNPAQQRAVLYAIYEHEGGKTMLAQIKQSAMKELLNQY